MVEKEHYEEAMNNVFSSLVVRNIVYITVERNVVRGCVVFCVTHNS